MLKHSCYRFGLLAILLMLFNTVVLAQAPVLLLHVNGAIGPATADYIERGIDSAYKDDAQLVVIQLDTPGGLDKSMREIIQAIMASPTPVATYVAPSGARAASAGTFILYASHIAAMAPGTNLGAASPVSIGSLPAIPAQPDDETPTSPTTIEKKIANDATAYIRSLAQLRGRDTKFAEAAVTEAETLTAQEAKARKVIEFIADDVPDLLTQLAGYSVSIHDSYMILDPAAAPIIDFKPDWRTQLLSVITDPTIAYILLLIGIYGLFFEFAHPGFVVPGVVGAICLMLALYALQMLPISYVGLGLILFGITFMVAEAFVPSFGALGIGGIIAFAVGSVMLMDVNLPEYAIAWQVIITMVAINALFFFVIINLAIRAYRSKVRSGKESLVGRTGHTLEDIAPTGQAKIQGEIWAVTAEKPLAKNTPIRVVAINGLQLTIEPLE